MARLPSRAARGHSDRRERPGDTVPGGHPAQPQLGVNLDNWQTAPRLRWSFQHVDELFPTCAISRGDGPVARLAPAPVDLGLVPVTLFDGTVITVADVMAQTDTDGWIVGRAGHVMAEHYPHGMAPGTRHLLMSISKSLVGTVAGALVDGGLLDPAAPLVSYVPELAASGYAGATVRHLLDMRSGIQFSEAYLDPAAEVRLLEQAIGWASRTQPGVPRTMYEFLLTLRQKGPHGGPFEYRSGETDVLGWICEAAAGERMPELMSRLLWSRIGAERDALIGVDSAGSGMFDGGICAALRDLVRFATMLASGGVSMTGERVVSAAWVEDTYRGDPDSRDAFAVSPTETLMPGGMYRNQFWLPYPDRDVLVCLGIHGQMVYVNPVTGVVAAKLSSWPEPQHAWKLFATLRAFDAVSTLLG